jgi:hypothetical protein
VQLFGRLPRCDVLLTHSPPKGAQPPTLLPAPRPRPTLRSRASAGHGDLNEWGKPACACPELSAAIAAMQPPPRFHCFGHNHTDWGAWRDEKTGTMHINAGSVSDFYYVRRTAPIVFDVPCSAV